MSNTENALNARQASGRLRSLFRRSGVSAMVTVTHGLGGSTYFISGDRTEAAELLHELGVPFHAGEFTMYVRHADIEKAL